MFKQVFDYNGNAFLVKTNDNGELLVDDLKRQGLYQYTDIMPPSNLFPPRIFDGEQWHGSTIKEDGKEDHKPSAIEYMLAQAQMQVTKTAARLITSQEEQAKVNLELTKKEKRIQQLEQQQADILLEIAKLKGE